MTIAQFPAYAVLLFDGLKETPQPNVRRTEMEGGYTKQAPKYTRQSVQVAVNYKLCGHDDVQAFKHFVSVDLRSGVLPFVWEDPRLFNAGVTACKRQARIVSGQISYEALDVRLSHEKASFVIEYLEGAAYV